MNTALVIVAVRYFGRGIPLVKGTKMKKFRLVCHFPPRRCSMERRPNENNVGIHSAALDTCQLMRIS